MMQDAEVLREHWLQRADDAQVTNSKGAGRRLQAIEYSPAGRVRDGAPHDSDGGKGAGSLTYEEQEAIAGASRTSVRRVSPESLEYVGSDATQSSELMKSIVKFPLGVPACHGRPPTRPFSFACTDFVSRGAVPAEFAFALLQTPDLAAVEGGLLSA